VPSGVEAEVCVHFAPFPYEGLRQVIDGLDGYNRSLTGLPAHDPVSLLLKGGSNEVLGGLLGHIWGRWLCISHLWVAGHVRSRGHGTTLMATADRYAVDRGCLGAFLSTFSFQARPFYEKLGYQAFATLENCPPGHSYFHMKKSFVVTLE
jgi:GNAT superfamily N-acetyltransferase